MPFGKIKLNDGRHLPEIGFGSWLIGSGQTVVEQTEQAIEVGFDHIDTAQIYGNEAEVGKGIKESGLERKDVWITTKWSGKDGKGPRQSLNESLEFLGVKSVDLYLIHHPRLTNGDPAGSWREMEALQKEGLAKSIAVSNFQISDLEALRLAGLSTPVVNQILLHPYVFAQTAELLAYHATHGIVTEAYSTLIPLTKQPGGPVDVILKEISERRRVSPAQVLFAWARSKGAVIVTTSSQKARLQDYLRAGDWELSPEEEADIDAAGAKFSMGKFAKRFAPLVGMSIVFVGLWKLAA